MENHTLQHIGYSFGQALQLLKEGSKVRRKGWNGAGMYLFLVHGFVDMEIRNLPEALPVLPAIVLRTAQDTFVVGWLPSTTDMLSEDWTTVV